ncbi:iron chelate uptake ABC transporter family permease subunit [Arthrobacter koreensis]|nr:putative F420-0 ABC transporter permease subunit [Arthrobacter koreensis]MEB7503306.1 iron chelate uptake ABC transporter family permease subunit [Arthrobacter koreensis]
MVGAALCLGLAAAGLWALTVGPAGLGVREAWLALTAPGSGSLTPLQEAIVRDLRLPRVLTAAAVGAGLALSGAVIQALTRNPLADPYLLGLSSGASLGAVSVLLLGAAVVLPVAAFAGAMLAMAGTLTLAGALGSITPTRTVLAGLAVSSLAAAAASFVVFWTAQGDSYREVLGWLMGSLAGATWSSTGIALPALAVVGIPLMFCGRLLDAFSFGDTAASALGVPVPAVRWTLLGATALLTGAMVSVSGSIGFVGLVLPHAVRMLAGPSHRALLPLSALAGALFLVLADTAARTVFDPREIPVGIVTALIGAPFFILLLLRRRSGA